MGVKMVAQKKNELTGSNFSSSLSSAMFYCLTIFISNMDVKVFAM
jgi:hypothetical protein